jgi:hypothetical protein
MNGTRGWFHRAPLPLDPPKKETKYFSAPDSCLLRLYFVMLCYVMLCHVMLCLCYAMLPYVMSCHAVLCCLMLCYNMSCHDVLCYVVLYCNTWQHLQAYSWLWPRDAGSGPPPINNKWTFTRFSEKWTILILEEKHGDKLQQIRITFLSSPFLAPSSAPFKENWAPAVQHGYCSSRKARCTLSLLPLPSFQLMNHPTPHSDFLPCKQIIMPATCWLSICFISSYKGKHVDYTTSLYEGFGLIIMTRNFSKDIRWSFLIQSDYTANFILTRNKCSAGWR